MRFETAEGVRLLPAAGIWGGVLTTETEDGWTIRPTDAGVVLEHRQGLTRQVVAFEELRALELSTDGSVAVVATSSTVRLMVRDTSNGQEKVTRK